jgi:GDPmannose 4,6-dehydratase
MGIKVFLLVFLYQTLSMTYSYSKSAIITGITGQDGSYLAEFLLAKGYRVHGIARRVTAFNDERVDSLVSSNDNLCLHYGDISNFTEMSDIINRVKPDEIYNLAAQSHVHVSFEAPYSTAMSTGIGALNILEAIRLSGLKIKFYQASSSEMFGLVNEMPQTEKTNFRPRSPYATSKIFAHWMVTNYREAYGIFAVSGILFNHESPRRGANFVTRKITNSVCKIFKGSKEPLILGNLDAKRDWGYAKDYVEAMWLMLQQEKPNDFVIGTGETHSVREFVELAFKVVGIEIQWSGVGVEEVGVNVATGEVLVKVEAKYFRPAEVDIVLADMTKAKTILGWEPKTKFSDIVRIMVDFDLKS